MDAAGNCAGALAGRCRRRDPRGRRKRGCCQENGRKEAGVRVMKQRTSDRGCNIKEGK